MLGRHVLGLALGLLLLMPAACSSGEESIGSVQQAAQGGTCPPKGCPPSDASCRTIADLPECNKAGCAWFSCSPDEKCHAKGSDICAICPGDHTCPPPGNCDNGVPLNGTACNPASPEKEFVCIRPDETSDRQWRERHCPNGHTCVGTHCQPIGASCESIGTLAECNAAGCAWFSCAETTKCRPKFSDICGVCPTYHGCPVAQTCDNNVPLGGTACNPAFPDLEFLCVDPGGLSGEQWAGRPCPVGQTCSGTQCQAQPGSDAMCRTIDDLPACNDAGCAWYSCAASEHCRAYGSDICSVCPAHPGCILNADGVVIFDPDTLTRFHGGPLDLADDRGWSSITAYVRYCQLTKRCLQDLEVGGQNADFSGITIPVWLTDQMGFHDPLWMSALQEGSVHARELDSIFFCPTGGCKGENMTGAPQQAWEAELWVETSDRRCNVFQTINPACLLPTPGDRIDEVLDLALQHKVRGYAFDVLTAFTTDTVSGFSRGGAMAIAYAGLASDQGHDITGYVYGTPGIWRNMLQDQLIAVEASPSDHRFSDIVGTLGTVGSTDHRAFVWSIYWLGDPVAWAPGAVEVFAAMANIWGTTGNVYHDYNNFHWAQYIGPRPDLTP